MTTLDLTRAGVFQRDHHEVQDPVISEVISSTADALELTVVEYSRRTGSIRRDLPEDIRRQEFVNATKAAGPALGEVDAKLGLLAKAVERGGAILTAGFRHQLPEGADVADENATGREIRAVWRGLDQNDRDGRYLDAAMRGDRRTMRAIELDPTGVPLVSAQFLEMGAEAFAKAVAPEEYATLKQQQAALSTVKGNLLRAAVAVGLRNDPTPEALIGVA